MRSGPAIGASTGMDTSTASSADYGTATLVTMKDTITYSPTGSISTATLRTADLLTAFISEAEAIQFRNAHYLSMPEHFDERDRIANLIGEMQDCFTDDGEDIDPDKEDEASELVNETMPELFDEYAAPYHRFGAHEGDGADFGYWADWEQIDDLPQIRDNTQDHIDAEQSDTMSTDVRYVNDHGNVTIYSPTGDVVAEFV